MGKEYNVRYRGNRWIGTKPCRWLPMGNSRFWVLTRDHVVCISVKPFRGQFACQWWSLVKGSGALRDKLLVERRRPEVKKVKLSERSAVKHLAPLETEYLCEHMAVIEALTMLQYDDGTPRQPGYMGIWVQGSTWFVRITDKDADATLTAEGRTFDEALDTLQLLLGSDTAPWEPNARRKKKG